MYLLMEKQHNRGQDGAGLANIKLDTEPGTRYISRKRSIGQKPIKDIFDHVNKRFRKLLKENPFMARANYGAAICYYYTKKYSMAQELFIKSKALKYNVENCNEFIDFLDFILAQLKMHSESQSK